MASRKYPPPFDRFVGHIRVTDDCWLWQGRLDRHGYGSFWLDGRQWRAHRAAYLMIRGTLPRQDLDHLCDRPSCVNPWHLRPATALENHDRRRLCSCGRCRRCKHRDYMRAYYHRKKETV